MTNPSIVITRFELWSYSYDTDKWERLPDTPFGKKAVSVMAAEPLTVICLDGSVLVLIEGKWNERTPLPGSVPDWKLKNPGAVLL